METQEQNTDSTGRKLERNDGKVLKKYKKRFVSRDPIINNISNSNVHNIKRMRIGNSMLKSHYGQGKSKLCTGCSEGVPETNEHYLLECNKFNK